jgi:putative spermidine/putrescine transport system permease protein
MGRVVRTFAVASLAYLCLPTLIVLISSLGGKGALNFPPDDLNLSAYGDLLGNSDMRSGLYRSVLLGLMCVAFAAIPGVLAALALFRHRVRFRPLLSGFLTLGLATPLVVSGMAFLLVYTRFGAIGQLWPIAIAITTVNFPILLYAVASSISTLDADLEDAAATLGAEEIQRFLFVTFPAILPGILTGLIMMFVFGMGEFLVTMILSTVDNQTLPVVMFGSLRGAVSGTLAAGGGIYILISLLVIFLVSRLRSIEDVLSRPDQG